MSKKFDDPCCGNCKFSAPDQTNMQNVVCQRFPPTEFLVPGPQGQAGFLIRYPTPRKTWKCGEHPLLKQNLIDAEILDS